MQSTAHGLHLSVGSWLQYCAQHARARSCRHCRRPSSASSSAVVVGGDVLLEFFDFSLVLRELPGMLLELPRVLRELPLKLADRARRADDLILEVKDAATQDSHVRRVALVRVHLAPRQRDLAAQRRVAALDRHHRARQQVLVDLREGHQHRIPTVGRDATVRAVDVAHVAAAAVVGHLLKMEILRAPLTRDRALRARALVDVTLIATDKVATA